MIQSEKKYWSEVNKDSVNKFCIELKEEFSVSQNILKSPTLINGVVIHNKKHVLNLLNMIILFILIIILMIKILCG